MRALGLVWGAAWKVVWSSVCSAALGAWGHGMVCLNHMPAARMSTASVLPGKAVPYMTAGR